MRAFAKILISVLIIVMIVGAYFYIKRPGNTGRSIRVMNWLRDPNSHPEWAMQPGVICNDAPFSFPTSGLVGFLWDDSFRPGHRHQGIDIFAGTDPGITPVYAAYDGYLTRLPDWKSSVIIRIPSDPLQPGRQVWIYYTHMADQSGSTFISSDFPAGTTERFVERGTPLGYQGNYSGTPDNPVGVHLHFSIVLDDGKNRFRNELDIHNTLDPSPYLGLPLNGPQNKTNELPICTPTEQQP